MKTKRESFEKIMLLAFLLLPTIAISLNLDNDFWFLFNQGRYVVKNGFPTIEPFTIHTDFSFIIQQWLFDVILYYLYISFGKFGVLTLVAFFALLNVFLLYKLCMLLSGECIYLSILFTMVGYFILCLWFMVTRPQIVTYTIVLTELFFLEKYVRQNKWKYLLILPLLSLLQINCHSSMWWLLFAFILPYLIESIKIKFRAINLVPIAWKPLFFTTILMFFTGFLNPYGYKAILYIFTSFGNETINQSIMEMGVPDIKSLDGFVFFALVLFVVLGYVCNRKGKTTIRYVLLALGTTFLSLMSIKSIPYFLFGTFIPLIYYVNNWGTQLTFKSKTKKSMGFLLAFIAVLYVSSVYVAVDGYDESKDYPDTKNAIAYLSKTDDPKTVTLYTSFYDGGYAEYNEFKTYIDARAEVFLKANNKKSDVFSEYIDLQNGNINYKEFLSNYQFTHILVNNTDILDIYLKDDINYSVYYEDEYSKIYIPVNS